LDDAVSRRAWTNYLDDLDPHHVCFLAKDIERFRDRADTLDDELRAGDLSFAYEAFDTYRQRMSNRIAYARSLLGTGFDLTVDETYAVAGDAWPSDSGEWDEVWRKETKNRVVHHAVERSTDPTRRWAAERVRTDLDARLAELCRPRVETVLARYLTAFARAYDADSTFVSPSSLAEMRACAQSFPGGTTSWSIRHAAKDDGGTNSLGVIRLAAFYGNVQGRRLRGDSWPSAAHDVSRILSHMRRRSVDGIVLDMRGNAGGCQPETVAVTGLFIGDGPVVMTKTARRRRVETHKDPDADVAYGGPLVVLVNRLSASAAEVLAGTLQDYGRAVIVGDSRTYGKGRCQTLHELGRDGSLGALSITTMVNYRVSGISAQGQGVTPDVVMPSAYEYCVERSAPANDALEPPVPAATYTRTADLSAVISRLREQSARRRKKDPRYRAYAERLVAVAQLARRDSMSLQLERRLELVRACGSELCGIRQLLYGDGPEMAVPNEATPDLVLDEALAILRDWVELKR